MAVIVEKTKDSFKEKEQLGGIWIARVLLTEDVDNNLVYALEQSFKSEPVEEDYENMKRSYLKTRKMVLTNRISEYDTSENVNSFILNGDKVWLDKATRVGLVNSLSIEKENEVTTTSLYLNGKEIKVGVDTALEILKSVEMYALACYRQTEKHIAAVNAASSVEELSEYDITSGYPEMLNFTI